MSNLKLNNTIAFNEQLQIWRACLLQLPFE